MKNDSAIEERKWATLFLEIALRAARRVHYEHGMWSVGRKPEIDPQGLWFLNMGRGIELADERTVCAAITQELINCPAAAGKWIQGNQKGSQRAGPHYFAIAREERYLTQDKWADLFLEKVQWNGRRYTPVRKPAFIEAKRARIWTPDVHGADHKEGAYQQAEVQKDIKKLRKEMRQRNKPKEQIICHVLVWGVYDKEKRRDSPTEFFEPLRDDLELQPYRWLPLKWGDSSSAESNDKPSTVVEVSRALWIALGEVKAKP